MENDIGQNILSGFGVYIDPPIWIGNIKDLSLNKGVIDGNGILRDIIKVEFYQKYKNRVLLIQSDGYFVIESKNTEEAQKLLNEILSLFLFEDIKVYKITQTSISVTKIDCENKVLVSSSHIGDQTRFYYRRDRPVYDFFIRKPVVLTSIEIENIIKKAELITSNDDWGRYMRMLLKSYTELLYLENDCSFGASWKIIEYCIKWHFDIIGLHVKDYTVNKAIKKLNEHGFFSDNKADKLHCLRDKRNDSFHKGITPSRDIVAKSYKTSKQFLKQILL